MKLVSQEFLNCKASKILKRQKLQEILREIFALASVFFYFKKIRR